MEVDPALGVPGADRFERVAGDPDHLEERQPAVRRVDRRQLGVSGEEHGDDLALAFDGPVEIEVVPLLSNGVLRRYTYAASLCIIVSAHIGGCSFPGARFKRKVSSN